MRNMKKITFTSFVGVYKWSIFICHRELIFLWFYLMGDESISLAMQI